MHREDRDLYPDVSAAEMRRWAARNFRRVEIIDPRGVRGGSPTRESHAAEYALVGVAGAAAAAFAFWWWKSGKAEAKPSSYLRGLDDVGALAA